MMQKTTGLCLALLLLSGCDGMFNEPEGEELKLEGTLELIEQNEAQMAYAEANARMHAGMDDIPEDADVAFMMGMILHHQGAVDMAEIVLKHGKDEETRALAESIIKAQKTEIAQMEAWLKARGVEVPAPAAGDADHAAMEH